MLKIAYSLTIGWLTLDRMDSSSAAAKLNPLQGSAGVVSTSSSSSGSVPKSKAKAKTKARIDIDDDIEEANRVTVMLKTIQKKAVTMNKTSKEMKQRIVQKASKLRAEDVERIAVLRSVGCSFQPERPLRRRAILPECEHHRMLIRSPWCKTRCPLFSQGPQGDVIC